MTPHEVIDRYRRRPEEAGAELGLLELRRQLAQTWLATPEANLPALLGGEGGVVQQALLDSGIQYLGAGGQEESFVGQIEGVIRRGLNDPQAIRCILAGMLYRRADQLGVPYDVRRAPAWFLQQYVWSIVRHPDVFDDPGDNDRWLDYLNAWLDHLLARIADEPASPMTQRAAWHTLEKLGLIQAYFSTRNLRDTFAKRGRVIDYVLRQLGHAVDYACPRPAGRPRIRLGILKPHFLAMTETFHTLPVFEHLDRSRFEVVLYAQWSQDTPVERYCRSRADRFVVLPEAMAERVRMIRQDELDILLVGSNVTAWMNDVVLMAAHRLAPVQTTIYSSPVTTGLLTMDRFISGRLSEPDDAQLAYTEQLQLLDGPGFAFSYIDSQPPVAVPTRAGLGIAGDAVVFASGSNYFKIIPEQRELWARVLAAVPESVLMLWPFSPAWCDSYLQRPFIQRLHAVFRRHGVDPKRLVLIPPLPSRSDVLEHLKLADVYLDSMRHSGSHTLADALEAGVPPVVYDGPYLRSRHAAGMMRAAGLTQLVCESEVGCFELAVRLGKEAGFRQEMRGIVVERMRKGAAFRDSAGYAVQIAGALEAMVGRGV